MGTDSLYYIMDYSGHYYRTDKADQLIAVAGEQDATVFTFAQANSRICVGKKASFYCMVPVEETAVKKVDIVPLEVIVRNVAAGSFSKRLGIEEGFKLLCPTLEFSYKDDDLGDPLINDYFAIAIGAATREDIDTITKYAFMVNDFLKKFFDDCGIDLIDFKIEFGKTSDGTIILADEISPDTCRFWDKKTHEKLDKDRFRRDLGGVEDAYQEVAKRIGLI